MLACPLYPTGCQLSLRKMEKWRAEIGRGGMEGGADDVRAPVPEAFSLALLFLICPPDGSKIKQNMAARRRRG